MASPTMVDDGLPLPWWKVATGRGGQVELSDRSFGKEAFAWGWKSSVRRQLQSPWETVTAHWPWAGRRHRRQLLSLGRD